MKNELIEMFCHYLWNCNCAFFHICFLVHKIFNGIAKLANIVHEYVKFDMFANNVAQFGHHVGQQIQVKKCSWHVCTCSKHFHEHFLFDRMLSNFATVFANNSTHSGKSCARIMQKSFKSNVTSTSLVAKWILD